MTTKRKSTKRNDGSNSPIVKPSRSIPASTTLVLYVQAGGRCEFDNCNEYLLEHRPTRLRANLGEQSHIWAFNEAGPRGRSAGRPSDVHALSNLMLLCKDCHHVIDT
jgi:hypothetical protein